MSDWTPNHLGFDSAGAMNLIREIIDWHLDSLSMFLQNIIRVILVGLGNGSKIMRLFAAAVVEETNREVTNDHVLLEVGIKMDQLPEDGFVRVYVVLHGNQSEGALHEKPGVATWNKHVLEKGVPEPDNRNSKNMLPEGFNQTDKMEDILDMVIKNVENDSNKRIKEFVSNVKNDISRVDFSQFITGG